MAWAVGVMDVCLPHLMTRLSQWVVLMSHQLSENAICNVAWAFAAVGTVLRLVFQTKRNTSRKAQARPVFEAFAPLLRQQQQLERFPTQGLRNLLWAFSTVQLPDAQHTRIISSIATVVTERDNYTVEGLMDSSVRCDTPELDSDIQRWCCLTPFA